MHMHSQMAQMCTHTHANIHIKMGEEIQIDPGVGKLGKVLGRH